MSLLLGCAPGPRPVDLPAEAVEHPTQLIAWRDDGAWTVVALAADRHALVPSGAEAVVVQAFAAHPSALGLPVGAPTPATGPRRSPRPDWPPAPAEAASLRFELPACPGGAADLDGFCPTGPCEAGFRDGGAGVCAADCLTGYRAEAGRCAPLCRDDLLVPGEGCEPRADGVGCSADCTLAPDSWCPVALADRCTANTWLRLSPPALDLGWLGEPWRGQVTLSNDGEGAMALSPPRSDLPGVVTVASACGALAAGESCALDLTVRAPPAGEERIQVDVDFSTETPVGRGRAVLPVRARGMSCGLDEHPDFRPAAMVESSAGALYLASPAECGGECKIGLLSIDSRGLLRHRELPVAHASGPTRLATGPEGMQVVVGGGTVRTLGAAGDKCFRDQVATDVPGCPYEPGLAGLEATTAAIGLGSTRVVLAAGGRLIDLDSQHREVSTRTLPDGLTGVALAFDPPRARLWVAVAPPRDGMAFPAEPPALFKLNPVETGTIAEVPLRFGESRFRTVTGMTVLDDGRLVLVGAHLDPHDASPTGYLAVLDPKAAGAIEAEWSLGEGVTPEVLTLGADGAIGVVAHVEVPGAPRAIRAFLWRDGPPEELRLPSCPDADVRGAVLERTGRLAVAVEIRSPDCRLPPEACRNPVGAILRAAP